MTIYEVASDHLDVLKDVTFDAAGVYERQDLQRLLRAQVEVISPDTMVIAEEFGQWDDSKRRIDLLGIDRNANLVVIELKRSESGAHMELQAVRYAAMVSTMTFEQAVRAYEHFLASTDRADVDARGSLLAFLEWDDVDEEAFGVDVRIVLASADFSKELVTSVLWMNSRGIDIRCIRMRPYEVAGKLLVDIQQLIPLPEAEDYEIKIREKTESVRIARGGPGPDFTRYDAVVDDEHYPNVWKRRLVLLAMHRAIDQHGADPEALKEICPPHARLFVSVDDTCSVEDEFVAAVTAEYVAKGRRFDRRRFFTADDELFHANGRTYAMTNQWAGNWRAAVAALCEACPGLTVTYQASG